MGINTHCVQCGHNLPKNKQAPKLSHADLSFLAHSLTNLLKEREAEEK